MFERFFTRLWVLAAALSWACGASAAASAHLVYVRGPGAESCPSEASIRGAVTARLGYDPFFPWAHDTLFVEVTGLRGAFRVELKLIDEGNFQRGVREITVKAVACAGVLDAMALTMSLAIDPASVIGASSSSAPQVAPAPEPTPPSPAPPLASAPSPDTRSPAPAPSSQGGAPALSIANTPSSTPPDSGALAPSSTSRRVQARMALRATGSAGVAPSATVGATALVGLRWRALSVDLEERFDLPSKGSTDLPNVRVVSWLVATSVVPCLHLGPVFGCAVGSVGLQTVTWLTTARSIWAAAGGRAGLQLPLSASWTVDGYGELLGTVPNDITVGGSSVDKLPAVSGGLGIGIGWRFL
jgi:hypothetical protein